MQYLKTLGESWGLMPSASAVVFLDNHDTQRGGAPLTYKSGDIYTFATIFMLSWPYGYPKVMSSYYFTDHDQGPPSARVHDQGALRCDDGKNWVCEHRRPGIANMVKWRTVAESAAVANWQTLGPDQIAFSRGGAAFIALNRGDARLFSHVATGLPSGSYCNVIVSDDVDSCPMIAVDTDGHATFQVNSFGVVAVHVAARIK